MTETFSVFVCVVVVAVNFYHSKYFEHIVVNFGLPSATLYNIKKLG